MCNYRCLHCLVYYIAWCISSVFALFLLFSCFLHTSFPSGINKVRLSLSWSQMSRTNIFVNIFLNFIMIDKKIMYLHFDEQTFTKLFNLIFTLYLWLFLWNSAQQKVQGAEWQISWDTSQTFTNVGWEEGDLCLCLYRDHMKAITTGKSGKQQWRWRLYWRMQLMPTTKLSYELIDPTKCERRTVNS